MKCHYEVLEVPRDAKVEDIKKARDKLAKKFHPDKAHQANDPSLVAEYTATFRLIQQAYEVLSDNHERAWYDSHREQILSSGNKTVQEDIALFSYFNTSCYSGYGDDENGFYAVYQKIFTQISAEDVRKAKDNYEEYDVPVFGNSTSPYDDIVNPFYGFWQSYSTKRTFYSLDKWDLREADNRRTSRAMEKENKRVRDAAKKEWNESVRELASFVRKRDPRVKAYRALLEQKAEENRLKVIALQEEQRRQRQELISSHVDRTDNAELEKRYRDLEKSHKKAGRGDTVSDGSADECDEDVEVIEEDDEDDDPLYCVSCEKRFKSVPAMRNHVQSKQHRKNMELLRAELVEEEGVEGLADDLDQLNVADTETSTQKPTAADVSVSKKAESVVAKPPIEDEEEETVILAQSEPVIEVEAYTSRNKSKKEKKTKMAQQKVQELGLKCAVCREVFPSRNKLFQHVKDENHAILK
ncbi:DnaJ-like protein subfamily C member 21 [Hypsibius exemplaris]|uniref:DnaJ-like protein subfamily C member 21 n=1 Tax=Hypsibius exemplaris TaxID=2072580 RepID=A0A1W0WST6_HYPEX|nr:DnaJ-like protein subfamily C member 21 [Hypsibius exemplaris]